MQLGSHPLYYGEILLLTIAWMQLSGWWIYPRYFRWIYPYERKNFRLRYLMIYPIALAVLFVTFFLPIGILMKIGNLWDVDSDTSWGCAFFVGLVALPVIVRGRISIVDEGKKRTTDLIDVEDGAKTRGGLLSSQQRRLVVDKLLLCVRCVMLAYSMVGIAGWSIFWSELAGYSSSLPPWETKSKASCDLFVVSPPFDSNMAVRQATE